MGKKKATPGPTAGQARKAYSAAKLTEAANQLRTQAASLLGFAKAMTDLSIEEVQLRDAMLIRSIKHIGNFSDSVGRAIREVQAEKL